MPNKKLKNLHKICWQCFTSIRKSKKVVIRVSTFQEAAATTSFIKSVFSKPKPPAIQSPTVSPDHKKPDQKKPEQKKSEMKKKT